MDDDGACRFPWSPLQGETHAPVLQEKKMPFYLREVQEASASASFSVRSCDGSPYALPLREDASVLHGSFALLLLFAVLLLALSPPV